MTVASENLTHPATLLESIADSQPGMPALVHGETRRTWSAFDDRSARLATALTDMGVPIAGVVGIYMRNNNELVETYCAALKMRATPININYRYLDDELVHLLLDSNCRALVFHAEFATRVARIRHRLPGLQALVMVGDGPMPVSSAVAYEHAITKYEPAERIHRPISDPSMTYTGGTTGLPKAVTAQIGARVSESSVRLSAEALQVPTQPTEFGAATATRLRQDGHSIVSVPLSPMMHATSLNVVAVPTLLFGGCVVTSTDTSYRPNAVLDLLNLEAATATVLVGDAMAKPFLGALIDRRANGVDFSLPALRAIVSSGMAWGAETMNSLLDCLPHVVLHELLGATEALMGSRTIRAGDAVSRTPRFVPVSGLKVLRPDDTEVPAGTGEPGLIAAPVPEDRHYQGDGAKTASVFRRVSGVRYAITGDWGTVDADGQLCPIGRGSTVINTGGEKVFPEEVEQVIRGLPTVIDCVVVGRPSERWGETVVALVSLSSGSACTEESIIAAVRERLSGYKIPRLVRLVQTIPRHPNAKIDYGAAHLLLDDELSNKS